MRREPGRKTCTYTHDLLKNTTALFGIRAGHRALYEYGPYGNIVRMEGNAAEDNPFRFSSEYADDELGLVYYNYRYYNPQNGRWISREPIGEIDGWNLYSFVNNRLIQYIDSLGFQAIDASLLGTGPTKFCRCSCIDRTCQGGSSCRSNSSSWKSGHSI